MLLGIRVALYVVAGKFATDLSWISFNEATHDLTVHIDRMPESVLGLALVAGTFAWSRFEKARGRLT